MHTQDFLKQITSRAIILLIALMLGITPMSGCGEFEGNVVYGTQTTAITKPTDVVYALDYVQGKLKPGAQSPAWWSRATAVKNGQTLDGVIIDQVRVENGAIKATLRGFNRPSSYKDKNIGDIPTSAARDTDTGTVTLDGAISYQSLSLENINTKVTVTFVADGWQVQIQYIVPGGSNYAPPLYGPSQAR